MKWCCPHSGGSSHSNGPRLRTLSTAKFVSRMILDPVKSTVNIIITSGFSFWLPSSLTLLCCKETVVWPYHSPLSDLRGQLPITLTPVLPSQFLHHSFWEMASLTFLISPFSSFCSCTRSNHPEVSSIPQPEAPGLPSAWLLQLLDSCLLSSVSYYRILLQEGVK